MFKQVAHKILLILFFTANVAFAQDSGNGVSSDLEYEQAPHIKIDALTSIQIENLKTTAKVWGFLKYHHPSVTSGQRQWDWDLLKILPEILAAPDKAAADASLHKWIEMLGPLKKCNPCAKLERGNYETLPDLEWINDKTLLSRELVEDLTHIYFNRSDNGNQFYVSQVPNVGNFAFVHEPEYRNMKFPDAGFQLLSLFRFWNIVQYWAPYRGLIQGEWDTVLRDSIRPVGLAKDRPSYELAMMAVIAQVHDTHVNLWSSLDVRPPVGKCQVPVIVRFVEGHAVVSGYSGDRRTRQDGIVIGDIIESVDGIGTEKLMATWKPYFAVSNNASLMRDIANAVTKGPCGDVKLGIRRGENVQDITVRRVLSSHVVTPRSHDRDGPTFQILNGEIAYIKLSSIKREDIPLYLARAESTKGLLIDLRNYPSEFVPFALGQFFVDKPTKFARVTVGDPAHPGAFKWGAELQIDPQQPKYSRKVIVLVDEMTQSQAEYTAMALRAGSQVKILGSTTAGADGNVSTIPLPGGLRSMISGIGIYYPDKRPTQRIGIVPDIEVKPTIRGIQEERDEVIDAAIVEILRN